MIFANLKAKVGAVAGAIVGAVSSLGLVVTSSGVTLEATDISVLNDANTAYLSTVFQVVQLLPYIAVMAWGFYLINKLFGIIPTGWGK